MSLKFQFGCNIVLCFSVAHFLVFGINKGYNTFVNHWAYQPNTGLKWFDPFDALPG